MEYYADPHCLCHFTILPATQCYLPVHFRQNRSIWFSGSQIASASHSKSKGCGRKRETRTSGVCLTREVSEAWQTCCWEVSQVPLCLCIRAGIHTEVFFLSALLLSPLHKKVLIHFCRILDVPSISWKEKAANIHRCPEGNRAFPWHSVTGDLSVPMGASRELQKSWP